MTSRLENTVQEVHRRILKLVGKKGSINETLENIGLYPHVDPKALVHFDEILSGFLSQRGITISVSEAIETDKIYTITPFRTEEITPQLSRLTQGQLDMTERMYRIASKVLKEMRDYSNPNHALENVLFAAGLPQDNTNIIPCSDRISDLITATREIDSSNGKFLCTLLLDSLDLMKAAYEKETSQKSNGKTAAEYVTHLNGILGKAEKICEEHKGGKIYDVESRAQELISYTRSILGLDNVSASRYSETPLRTMTEKEFIEMFNRGADETSLSNMEFNYGGALVAVDRKANRSTGRVGFTLTFRNDETGAVNSVSVGLGNSAKKEQLDVVFYHLIPRAESNMKGLQPSEIGIFAPRTSRARGDMKYHGYDV